MKFFKYAIFFIHRTNKIKKMLNKVSYKTIQVVSHGHCFTTFEKVFIIFATELRDSYKPSTRSLIHLADLNEGELYSLVSEVVIKENIPTDLFYFLNRERFLGRFY